MCDKNIEINFELFDTFEICNDKITIKKNGINNYEKKQYDISSVERDINTKKLNEYLQSIKSKNKTDDTEIKKLLQYNEKLTDEDTRINKIIDELKKELEKNFDKDQERRKLKEENKGLKEHTDRNRNTVEIMTRSLMDDKDKEKEYERQLNANKSREETARRSFNDARRIIETKIDKTLKTYDDVIKKMFPDSQILPNDGKEIFLDEINETIAKEYIFQESAKVAQYQADVFRHLIYNDNTLLKEIYKKLIDNFIRLQGNYVEVRDDVEGDDEGGYEGGYEGDNANDLVGGGVPFGNPLRQSNTSSRKYPNGTNTNSTTRRIIYSKPVSTATNGTISDISVVRPTKTPIKTKSIETKPIQKIEGYVQNTIYFYNSFNDFIKKIKIFIYNNPLFFKLNSLTIDKLKDLVNFLQIKSSDDLIYPIQIIIYIFYDFIFIDIEDILKSEDYLKEHFTAVDLRDIHSANLYLQEKINKYYENDTKNSNEILDVLKITNTDTDQRKKVHIFRLITILEEALKDSQTRKLKHIANIKSLSLYYYYFIVKCKYKLHIIKKTYDEINNNQAYKNTFLMLDTYITQQNENNILTYLKINNKFSGDKEKFYNRRFDINLYYNNDTFKTTFMALNYCDIDRTFYDQNNRFKSDALTVRNADESVIPYNQGYILGAFTDIFKPSLNNSQISEKLELLKQKAKTGVPIFIIGYGASGAGKTSSLIYFYKGRTEDEKNGILIHLCNALGSDGYTKLEVSVKEFYDTVKEEGNIDCMKHDNDDSFCKEIILNFEFRTDPTTKDENFICTTKAEEIKNKAKKHFDRSCSYEFNDIKLAPVIEFLVDGDRLVKATTNNPNSSRSHAIVFIKMTNNDNKNAYIIIGDFAGVENEFLCNEHGVITDFLSLEKDKQSNISDSDTSLTGGTGGNEGCEVSNSKYFYRKSTEPLYTVTKLTSDVYSNTEFGKDNFYTSNIGRKCKQNGFMFEHLLTIILNFFKITDDESFSKANIEYIDESLHNINKIINAKSTDELMPDINTEVDKVFYKIIKENKINFKSLGEMQKICKRYRQIIEIYYKLRSTDNHYIYSGESFNFISKFKCIIRNSNGYKIPNSSNVYDIIFFQKNKKIITDFLNFSEESLKQNIKEILNGNTSDNIIRIYSKCDDFDMTEDIKEQISKVISFKPIKDAINDSVGEVYKDFLPIISEIDISKDKDELHNELSNFNKNNRLFTDIVAYFNRVTDSKQLKPENYEKFFPEYKDVLETINNILLFIKPKLEQLQEEIRIGKLECGYRYKEGKFINSSLMSLRKSIRDIMIYKNKDTIFYSPSFYNGCLDNYCGSSACFELIGEVKTNKMDDIQSDIIKYIYTKLFKYKYKQQNDDINAEDNIKQFYNEFIICLFCVFNISYEANNPPPVPYVNINELKRMFNNYKGSDETTMNELLNYIKIAYYMIKGDYFDRKKMESLYNLQFTGSKSDYPTILENIQKIILKNTDYYTGVSQSNNLFELVLKEFITMIDNFNAASTIGTLEYIDSFSKLNTTNYICHSLNNIHDLEGFEPLSGTKIRDSQIVKFSEYFSQKISNYSFNRPYTEKKIKEQPIIQPPIVFSPLPALPIEEKRKRVKHETKSKKNTGNRTEASIKKHKEKQERAIELKKKKGVRFGGGKTYNNKTYKNKTIKRIV